MCCHKDVPAITPCPLPAACDFCFFFGVLIYQAAVAHSLMSGIRLDAEQRDSFFATDDGSDGGSSSDSQDDSSSSSSGSGIRPLVPLAWWLNPSNLRLEDMVFSIVIDIVAAAGGLVSGFVRHAAAAVAVTS
jgi:hypothetical protein